MAGRRPTPPVRRDSRPSDTTRRLGGRPRDTADFGSAEAEALGQELAAGAAALDVPLEAGQVIRLIRYLGLLRRWGAVHNLSAIDTPAAMVRLHLLDSLAIVPLLDRYRPGGGCLLDVGSGAGLPAVVLAIARPAWRVVAVDAVAKKAGFVAQVAIELGLLNLEALHARVEALGDPSAPPSLASRRWAQLAPQGADLVVSRAFASLDDFIRLTHRAVAPDGVWLAMKGRHPEDELQLVALSRSDLRVDAPAVEVFHVEPLTVPGLDAERCAVWMRRRTAGGGRAEGAGPGRP